MYESWPGIPPRNRTPGPPGRLNSLNNLILLDKYEMVETQMAGARSLVRRRRDDRNPDAAGHAEDNAFELRKVC
jgi:hypothetical protein